MRLGEGVLFVFLFQFVSTCAVVTLSISNRSRWKFSDSGVTARGAGGGRGYGAWRVVVCGSVLVHLHMDLVYRADGSKTNIGFLIRV